MTAEPRAWLPAGSITEDRVKRALVRLLDRWATRYFADPGAIDLIVRSDKRLRTEEDALIVERPPLRIALPDSARRHLLALALGTHGGDETEAETALLDRFARSLIEELGDTLYPALQSVSASTPQLQIEMMFAGKNLGTLTLPQDALVALVRTQLPSTMRQSPVVPRRAALSGVDVALSAVLGNAELSIEDAGNLAVGDVLILDRPVAEGAILQIEAVARTFARGELSTEGENNILILTSL